jgi:hypothetical protein
MSTDRVYIAWMAEETIQDPRAELSVYPNLEAALQQEAAKFRDEVPNWRWDQDISVWVLYLSADKDAQPITYVASKPVHVTSS